MITVYGPPVTLEQLRAIPVVKPARARGVWKGIQHGDLADAILDETRGRGWNIHGYQFSVAGKDDCSMVGAFDLSIPDLPAPDGQTLSLGVTTSNSGHDTLRLLVGTTVRICTNGMATGEIVLKARHTTRFDLYGGIERGLDEYERKARDIHIVVARLQETTVTADAVEHILMEAGRKGLMPWSRIGHVDAEYASEKHIAMHGHGTAWSLLNAFTEVVKQNPVWRQMREMNAFRGLLLA